MTIFEFAKKYNAVIKGDNLTVNGSLYCSHNNIDYGVDCCGKNNRFVVFRKINGIHKTNLGCFCGTLSECVAEIGEKYTQPKKYIDGVTVAYKKFIAHFGYETQP